MSVHIQEWVENPHPTLRLGMHKLNSQMDLTWEQVWMMMQQYCLTWKSVIRVQVLEPLHPHRMDYRWHILDLSIPEPELGLLMPVLGMKSDPIGLGLTLELLFVC